jgi:nucleoid-associated protein YgaU
VRRAINENPVVQAALIGVLVIVGGLMLLMRMGGSDEPAAEAPVAAAPATDSAAAAPAAGAPATDPTAAAPATGTPAPAGAAPAGAPGSFKAGPGLPEEIVAAYDAGDAVVVLVVNERGIDDRRLKTMVQALKSNPGAAVFVVDVRDVADYSRITEGVDLDRTPALVVLRPKALTEGSMPSAVVSYGFRGEASVQQALEDALYKGPEDLPYYPK